MFLVFLGFGSFFVFVSGFLGFRVSGLMALVFSFGAALRIYHESQPLTFRHKTWHQVFCGVGYSKDQAMGP